MENAGRAIKLMREAQGLSQRELARLARVNPGYLSQVERDLVDPTPRWLEAVTTALGRNLAGVA